MLRQLIVPPRPSATMLAMKPSGSLSPAQHDVDSALIPAILDVFMQSVQDDDSFVFLNAVQGLSAMVDRLGRNILARLMDAYAGGDGLMRGSMSRTELDKRLRVGEALGQVVRRCGDALPAYGACCFSTRSYLSYNSIRVCGHCSDTSDHIFRGALCDVRIVDVMVPKLMHVFHSTYLPTNLRSSSISTLAACMEVSSIALLPWTDELVSGLTDLLQVESVSFTATPISRGATTEESSAPRTADDITTDDSGEPITRDTGSARINRHPEEDTIPALTMSAKAPTLRRAALHFLSLLLRAFVLRIYEEVEDARIRNPDLAPMRSPLGSIQSLPSALNVMKGGRSGQVGTLMVQGIPLDSETIRRLSIVMRYVCDTDIDGIVRAQASECVELLEQLAEARIGVIN